MNASTKQIDPALEHSRTVNSKGTIVEAFGMRLTCTGQQTTSGGYPATVFCNEAGKNVTITYAFQNRNSMTVLEAANA